VPDAQVVINGGKLVWALLVTNRVSWVQGFSYGRAQSACVTYILLFDMRSPRHIITAWVQSLSHTAWALSSPSLRTGGRHGTERHRIRSPSSPCVVKGHIDESLLFFFPEYQWPSGGQSTKDSRSKTASCPAMEYSI